MTAAHLVSVHNRDALADNDVAERRKEIHEHRQCNALRKRYSRGIVYFDAVFKVAHADTVSVRQGEDDDLRRDRVWNCLAEICEEINSLCSRAQSSSVTEIVCAAPRRPGVGRRSHRPCKLRARVSKPCADVIHIRFCVFTRLRLYSKPNLSKFFMITLISK